MRKKHEKSGNILNKLRNMYRFIFHSLSNFNGKEKVFQISKGRESKEDILSEKERQSERKCIRKSK